jgi:hypothetical protein
MNEQINTLADMIKERINQNYEIIKENEEVIKNLIIHSKIDNRSELITKSFNLNIKLKAESVELINIHLQLVNYLSKFKEVLENQAQKASNIYNNIEGEINASDSIEPIDYSISFSDENIDEEQIFTQTIEGELIFESSHPRFYDQNFFIRLLNYYKDSENYEMCSLLLLLKGKK